MTTATRATQSLARIALAATAIALWQTWAAYRDSPFFPPPLTIAAVMYHLWFSGPISHLCLTPTALANIVPSIARTAGGLVLAIAVGLPAGIALGRSVALAAYLEPLVHCARSVPAVALVTVFIAIFPLGTPMEVAFIAFGTVWPILLNTLRGARSLDRVQDDTARVIHLTRSQRVAWLILPATAPAFLAGLRVSVSLALVLMVIAELTGTTSGIGYEMSNAAGSPDALTVLWAGIILLGVIGYAANAALLAAERHLLAWHQAPRDTRR